MHILVIQHPFFFDSKFCLIISLIVTKSAFGRSRTNLPTVISQIRFIMFPIPCSKIIFLYTLLSELSQYGYSGTPLMCMGAFVTTHAYYNLASLCDNVTESYPYAISTLAGSASCSSCASSGTQWVK